MTAAPADPFHFMTFFERAGDSRSTLQCQKLHTLFVQGDAANAVFYIHTGRVKLTVVSPQGKEAVVAILGRGDFLGETCLAGQAVCLATATTLDASTIVRIDKGAMNRALYSEPEFLELFMRHLVTRNIRIQEDLIDQLFNSAEKRLARTLLLLADFEHQADPELAIAKISQETLAEMIGTTRSRVSFFLNRFKKLGCIEYSNGLHVHRSLLNSVLSS
jgi:CRP/FNR family transcriptional regulator, cyclic AMP receptor protein